MEREVRIVIADDHRMVRKAWELLLSECPSFKVVGQAANGAEVLRVLQEVKTDIVLMDLDMPIMNGLEATEKIRNRYPWVKVIALTQQKESGYIKKLFAAGASGFLTKNSSEEELMEAIERVVNGNRYFSKEVSEVLSNSLLMPATEATASETFAGLSSREIEVVKLIAAGKTTSQIADTLSLSIKTVESHRRNIFKKLQVKNVAQMISKTKERLM